MILIEAEDSLERTESAGHQFVICGRGLLPKGLQTSDLGLLGRKSDGSSAVPEHPQSQVRITQSSVLRMKPLRANVSARILGIHQPAVKWNYFTGSEPTNGGRPSPPNSWC